MPCTVTSRSIASTCTQAWLGATQPASSWKSVAIMSRSRIEPLVMQPCTPRPLCTVVLTSPQKAPKPGSGSRSSITVIVGAGGAATYS